MSLSRIEPDEVMLAALDVIEPYAMDDSTVYTKGIVSEEGYGFARPSPTNLIRVCENQSMLLTDGDQITDYASRPGYYRHVPREGEEGSRVRVCYVNRQEMRGIPLSSRHPVNYWDSYYQAELFLRVFGTCAFRVSDPILFARRCVPDLAQKVEASEVMVDREHEVMQALQGALSALSRDGVHLRRFASMGRELLESTCRELNEEWRGELGIEITAISIATLALDENSEELARLKDANPAGPARKIDMQNYMPNKVSKRGLTRTRATEAVQTQPAPPDWICSCGQENSGEHMYCDECGKSRPQSVCAVCGYFPRRQSSKFCPQCGNRLQ